MERERKLLSLQVRVQFCICVSYLDLTNTSKATFWSEPCTSNLHSKRKQHSNMWETRMQKWLWEEREGPFSWVTLEANVLSTGKPDSYIEQPQTGWDLRGRDSHSAQFILYGFFSLSSTGCKQGNARLIRMNKTCSHLFCDNRLILMSRGGRGRQLKAEGGAGKEEEFSGLSSGQCGVSVWAEWSCNGLYSKGPCIQQHHYNSIVVNMIQSMH